MIFDIGALQIMHIESKYVQDSSFIRFSFSALFACMRLCVRVCVLRLSYIYVWAFPCVCKRFSHSAADRLKWGLDSHMHRQPSSTPQLQCSRAREGAGQTAWSPPSPLSHSRTHTHTLAHTLVRRLSPLSGRQTTTIRRTAHICHSHTHMRYSKRISTHMRLCNMCSVHL